MAHYASAVFQLYPVCLHFLMLLIGRTGLSASVKMLLIQSRKFPKGLQLECASLPMYVITLQLIVLILGDLDANFV